MVQAGRDRALPPVPRRTTVPGPSRGLRTHRPSGYLQFGGSHPRPGQPRHRTSQRSSWPSQLASVARGLRGALLCSSRRAHGRRHRHYRRRPPQRVPGRQEADVATRAEGPIKLSNREGNRQCGRHAVEGQLSSSTRPPPAARDRGELGRLTRRPAPCSCPRTPGCAAPARR